MPKEECQLDTALPSDHVAPQGHEAAISIAGLHSVLMLSSQADLIGVGQEIAWGCAGRARAHSAGVTGPLLQHDTQAAGRPRWQSMAGDILSKITGNQTVQY